jgi:hypothetical protein
MVFHCQEGTQIKAVSEQAAEENILRNREWRTLRKEEHHKLHSSLNIAVEARRVGLAEYAACMREN